MLKSTAHGVLLCLIAGSGAICQHRVDKLDQGEKAILVVPIVGSGKSVADPKRPLLPLQLGTGSLDVVEWNWTPSDDGKLAIVQVTGRNKAALAALLGDKAVLQSYQKNKDKKESIESELKKLKKDFVLEPHKPTIGSAK